MMNNEIKMPANFAAIDENEMVYLQGGATTEGYRLGRVPERWQAVQLHRPRVPRRRSTVTTSMLS